MPQNISAAASESRDLDPVRILRQLGVDADNSASFLKDLPFALDDTTAGSETELQAVVIGRREDVDLPITIEESNYFANIERRAAAGQLRRREPLAKDFAGERRNLPTDPARPHRRE